MLMYGMVHLDSDLDDIASEFLLLIRLCMAGSFKCIIQFLNVSVTCMVWFIWVLIPSTRPTPGKERGKKKGGKGRRRSGVL